MSIDRRKRYFINLDTETCPLDKECDKVTPQNMWVYDCGFAVIDKKGHIYEQYSFVVKEIFFGEKELMKSSYYAEKLPQYYNDIRSGKRVVKSFYEIRAIIKDCMERYNTNIVIAHNARFDDGVLANTQRWLTKSKYRYFFPYGTEVWDTLKMSRDVLSKMPTYKNFCQENGYITARGQLRYTAEIIFRYISKNNDFVENHTGLEDVDIERQIFAYLVRQHKPMRKKLYA